MTRYIAGGVILIPLLTFVGNLAWGYITDAHETADKAMAQVQVVDARQEKLEALYEQQNDFNRELINIQRHDRGMAPLPTPSPSAEEAEEEGGD